MSLLNSSAADLLARLRSGELSAETLMAQVLGQGGVVHYAAAGSSGLMALADAGPLNDPFIGRIDELGQIGIGHGLFRQIGTDAGHGATNNSH